MCVCVTDREIDRERERTKRACLAEGWSENDDKTQRKRVHV